MRTLRRVMLLATIATALLGVVNAWAIDPEITAEVRSRSEANLHRGVPLQSVDDNTLNIREYLRTRLNFNLVKDENTRAFIQLQDSRVYGGDAGVSGGLTNDMNLGIHQAYIEFDHWLWHRLHGRVGRQEITYGNHRLIGNVGWSNVGRTFDAGKVSLKFDKVTLEAVAATLAEADSADGQMGSNADKMMGILGVLLPEQNAEFLFIAEVDGTRNKVQTDKRVLQRGTLAAYSARKFGTSFDYIANLAFQGGKQVDTAGVERDIQAYLAALELGYTLAGEGKARLALGIDVTSGDDGTDSTKIKEFNNLYYTGHKFRGHMDNFLAPNGLSATAGKGLTDLMVRGAVNFHPAWRIGADVHLFQTAQDYASAVDSSLTKSIGTEIDLWIKAAEYRGVSWQYGASLFSWTEDYVGLNRETSQLWMYAQASMAIK